MPTEIETYRDYMTDVRMRIDEITRTMGSADMPNFAKQEMVFLQLRKVLELIAFASLAANKDAYAAARPTFSEDWNAKRIIKRIKESRKSMRTSTRWRLTRRKRLRREESTFLHIQTVL